MSQEANKNASTDLKFEPEFIKYKLSSVEITFPIKEGFGAAGMDNFLQYDSFRFKFGRQLHRDVWNNPPKFPKVQREIKPIFWIRGVV